jgi:hypothetical protein
LGAQKLHDLDLVRRIERGCRLVGEQQRSSDCERTSQEYQGALATRERRDRTIGLTQNVAVGKSFGDCAIITFG